MYNRRAIRIGIALNNADIEAEPFIKEQYATSQTVYNEISQVLIKHGAEVMQIEASGNFFERLYNLDGDIDVVFNLAEDIYQAGVPTIVDQVRFERGRQHPVCTGSTIEGHVLALNKARARQILADYVPQPEWWYVNHSESCLFEEIKFPALLKPSNEGHSIGIEEKNIVESHEELELAFTQLQDRLGSSILIESFLDGVEYSMGLVGEVVMPAVSWDLEQLPGQPLVRSEQLKQQNMTIPHAKLVSDPTLAASLATQTIIAHTKLGLLDYSRSDFRARKGDATAYYIETNSMPGLVNMHSVLPWAAAGAGIDYDDLIGAIVARTLKRLPEDFLHELDTQKFDEAYDRLKEKATKTGKKISVSGRIFYLLQPTVQQN